MSISAKAFVAGVLIVLGLLIAAARADSVEDVHLRVSKTDGKDEFQLTIVNDGKRPTESFFGARGLVWVRVLRPDHSTRTDKAIELFTHFDAVHPGERISVTRTSRQLVGPCKFSGTYRFYLLYRDRRSNAISFEVEEGKEPKTSQVAEDAIECYRQLGTNVGRFSTMLTPADGGVDLEARQALIDLSRAQIKFFQTVERKFGEAAAQTHWPFAWEDKTMAEEFRKGEVEILGDHFDAATLKPKGWNMTIFLQRGPEDHWILDVKTFSRSAFARKELAASAEKLKRISTAIDDNKYGSLREVVQAVNEAYAPQKEDAADTAPSSATPPASERKRDHRKIRRVGRALSRPSFPAELRPILPPLTSRNDGSC